MRYNTIRLAARPGAPSWMDHAPDTGIKDGRLPVEFYFRSGIGCYILLLDITAAGELEMSATVWRADEEVVIVRKEVEEVSESSSAESSSSSEGEESSEEEE